MSIRKRIINETRGKFFSVRVRYERMMLAKIKVIPYPMSMILLFFIRSASEKIKVVKSRQSRKERA